jgi:AcrR family transcriptional regulator
MTLIAEHMEGDTRDRILEVAERLFRQIGYQKTTVGDIAKEFRMSPANVYRFFESKKAIHQAVAQGLMGEVELEAQRIRNLHLEGVDGRNMGPVVARQHDSRFGHAARKIFPEADPQTVIQLASHRRSGDPDTCKAKVSRKGPSERSDLSFKPDLGFLLCLQQEPLP